MLESRNSGGEVQSQIRATWRALRSALSSTLKKRLTPPTLSERRCYANHEVNRACRLVNQVSPTDLHQARKTEVTINLLPFGINRSERFKDVRANSLPKAVLDQMDGVADAGEPFNATDVIDDPGVPGKSLIVAAIAAGIATLVG